MRLEPFAIVALGFLLGMRHATDPDHVIAVSTIVSREGSARRAVLVGAAWGLGHTVTIVIVGSAMVVFRAVVPARLGLAMELMVGLMLIVLGLSNLRGLFASAAAAAVSEPRHGLVHYHAHGDYIHTHAPANGRTHAHDPERHPLAVMDRCFGGAKPYQWVRPLLIGVVHGLAGSAAIALLVLSTIATVGWAMTYLVFFGVGTIAGMMVITLTLGSTFAYTQRHFAIGRHFGWAAGAISVVFGLLITYQIGFVDGLFGTQAHWLPR